MKRKEREGKIAFLAFWINKPKLILLFAINGNLFALIGNAIHSQNTALIKTMIVCFSLLLMIYACQKFNDNIDKTTSNIRYAFNKQNLPLYLYIESFKEKFKVDKKTSIAAYLLIVLLIAQTWLFSEF